ncbi:putative nucleoporin protein [Neofusicoccum parvum UCRNP2]|uniref:Putative nucleoporin protein n=1 Tax=Botryosphaeria parva (strain UCR-NP2) TaxID=1287680 RepID=R1ECU9_BOTPV|nr:putative nucleoporin protein [Neofusicoccum parvum UCRNP2]
MAATPGDSVLFPPLDKCLTGEQQLLSWKDAFVALRDSKNGREGDALRAFLSDDANVAVLSKPFQPFQPPNTQSKSAFETKTAAINVTPSDNGQYNIDDIKEDTKWLSAEVNIEEVSALRIVVLEWHARPATQLLAGFTEEETLSVQDAAGGANLGSSTFLPKSSILAATASGMGQNFAAFHSKEKRQIRILETYLSERIHILKISDLLVRLGAAAAQANGSASVAALGADAQPAWVGELGKRVFSSQKTGFIKDGTKALQKRFQGIAAGSGWYKDVPEGNEEAEELWGQSQLAEAICILQLIFTHVDTTPDLLPSDVVVDWFEAMAGCSFCKDIQLVIRGNSETLSHERETQITHGPPEVDLTVVEKLNDMIKGVSLNEEDEEDNATTLTKASIIGARVYELVPEIALNLTITFSDGNGNDGYAADLGHHLEARMRLQLLWLIHEEGELVTTKWLQDKGQFTHVIPYGFEGYVPTREDEVPSVQLKEDMSLFWDRKASKRPIADEETEGNELVPIDEMPADEVHFIPVGTEGIALNPDSKPLVIAWAHKHSALRYLAAYLSTFLVGNETVETATQQPISIDTATEYIGLLAMLVNAAGKAASARDADPRKDAQWILEDASDGLARNQDIISLVFDIFEQELERLREKPNNDGSLELLVNCLYFIHSLVAVFPNRVWPFFTRSRLLDLEGTGGSLVEIVSGTEMVAGRYDFLLGCAHLFKALANDSIKHVVSRKQSGKEVVRFSSIPTAGGGSPDKITSKVLLSFTKTFTGVYESCPSWRFGAIDQKLELNRLTMETFSDILRTVHGYDDEATSAADKLSSVLAPAADYLLEAFCSDSTNDISTHAILNIFFTGTKPLPISTAVRIEKLWRSQTKAAISFAITILQAGVLDFLVSIMDFIRALQPVSAGASPETVETQSIKIQMASLVSDIGAMCLHYARQLGDMRPAQHVIAKLDFLQKHGVDPPGYNQSLHTNLKKNVESKFPGVKLSNFKRSLLTRSEFGRDYFYDLQYASEVLGFDPTWVGLRKDSGFADEFQRANVNLSLVEAQITLLKSWKLLAIELASIADKDHRLEEILSNVVEQCLRANQRSNGSQALFERLVHVRADFAFVLMQKLIAADCNSDHIKALFSVCWDTIRMSGVDFEIAFMGENAYYYRTLLRILFLTLQPHIKAAKQKEEPGIQKNIPQIASQLMEILEKVVATGLRSLANQVHEDQESCSPSDFVLISALLSAILRIPGMNVLAGEINLLFSNANTIRHATSLFTWADQLAVDGDPIYGELSILFLLELSSILPMAETLAVEGVLSRLSTANLVNYYRKPRGMGPFDNPPRLFSIWTRGILPLCLNLLDAVGAPVAAEVSAFLNQFPEQLARASAALNPRNAPTAKDPNAGAVSLGAASEAHSLALVAVVLDRFRADSAAAAGVNPQDILPLNWDRAGVKEDVEGWLQGRRGLRDRLVPTNERELELVKQRAAGGGAESRLEERVVVELTGALECLNDGGA